MRQHTWLYLHYIQWDVYFYDKNYKKIGKTKCVNKRMCEYTTSYIKPLEKLIFKLVYKNKLV